MRLAELPSIQRGWFGNPCVQAVFKLCASNIHITLKVKSSSSIEVMSPTLLLLESTDSWLIVYRDGNISTRGGVAGINYKDVDYVCSLCDISHAPECEKDRLVTSFLNMVLLESGSRLDNTEMWYFELRMLQNLMVVL